MTDTLRVGIAGLGTVGASVARNLLERELRLGQQAGRPIVLTAISARSRDKERGFETNGLTWFDDPVELAKSDQIDLFVELIGGEEGAAYDAVKSALAAGKHVVTANKALLAHHGVGLARLAEASSCALGFEAAVAGGIPIIKALKEGLSGNEVSRVWGILNGTCNYILTRMEEEGLDFATCLQSAQELGYAEADPTFDVDGFDTAHKLAILSSLAFGSEITIDTMYVEGIRQITLEDVKAAQEQGYRIKLLGVAVRTQTGIEQRVHPTLVPVTSPLGRTNGVLNAVAVDGDYIGGICMEGPGAGGDATASAVIADIVDIARGSKAFPLGIPANDLSPFVPSKMRGHQGAYFIRLSVLDQPGSMAGMAQHLADQGISLSSIVQHGPPPTRRADAVEDRVIVLVTHETSETSINAALAAINADERVAEKAQMIRIETEA